MKRHMLVILCFALFPSLVIGDEPQMSEDTEMCLECHGYMNPGIVSAWKQSPHAKITPAEALKKSKLKRLVSAESIPDELSNISVGCAECHLLNPDTHKDTFDHNDYMVHSVVTPADCAVCHPVETVQYSKNLMSQAYGNLQHNPVYRSLVDSINGVHSYSNMKITLEKSDVETDADSCFYCHGTEIKIEGTRTIETDDGEMTFPVLSGWPNHGVGRINPDGTKGSCSACHTRHSFSIETARKPQTCSECHKGPDVPAYGVYSVSKHGNIYSSMGSKWDFKSVPWTVGKDFASPTCATCHASLLVSEEGDVISERTHGMSDRLPWRIFGLIYAHAHPKSPDTTIIKNSAGLPLPTDLTGESATDYLIDKEEQDKRQNTMQQVCLSCHSLSWVDGHFKRLDKSLKTTNEMTLTATRILSDAWEHGFAKGLAQNDSIFNESIEKKWIEQWLFYANSTRFASAMSGSDYGAFENGRWHMSKNMQEMIEWLESRKK